MLTFPPTIRTGEIVVQFAVPTDSQYYCQLGTVIDSDNETVTIEYQSLPTVCTTILNVVAVPGDDQRVDLWIFKFVVDGVTESDALYVNLNWNEEQVRGLLLDHHFNGINDLVRVARPS